ncbi:MAG: hypothetical protein ACREMK_08830 [Gemmatimonadota bacterium]
MKRCSSTRSRPPRAGFGVASAMLMLGLAVSPVSAGAQSAWDYEQDLRFTYEFDDNVNEQLDDPVRSQVARVAYRGDLRWGASGQQRLTLSYQGGFKRHFGFVDREDFQLGNQFVNEGSVGYLRRVSERVAFGGQLGVKNRKWTDEFFLFNEDGFTRLMGSANTVVDLQPLAEDRAARLEMGARASTVDFENLDAVFGSDGVGGFVSLAKEFGPDLQATWTYSLDRYRYPGRAVIEPTDAIPSNVFLSPTRERQADQLHQLGLELTWLGDISIQADYRFRYNDSNSFGFSYLSHSMGLQVLRRLPWEMLLQFYGRVDLKTFSEPVPNLEGAGSINIGDAAADNVFLIRLVKDVTPDYSIEARYGRYRNESITLNDFYTKNVYSIGVNYRP